MKAIVDLSRCSGHARCYGVDPELFQLDDIGYAVRSEDITVVLMAIYYTPVAS